MRKTITQSVDAKSFIPTPYTTVGQMKQAINNWLSAETIASYTIESVIFSDGSVLTPVVLSTNTYDNVNFLGQEKILPGAQIVVNVTMFEVHKPVREINPNSIIADIDPKDIAAYIKNVTGVGVYFTEDEDGDLVKDDGTIIMKKALIGYLKFKDHIPNLITLIRLNFPTK